MSQEGMGELRFKTQLVLPEFLRHVRLVPMECLIRWLMSVLNRWQTSWHFNPANSLHNLLEDDCNHVSV
jgi:hypothetical protein